MTRTEATLAALVSVCDTSHAIRARYVARTPQPHGDQVIALDRSAYLCHEVRALRTRLVALEAAARAVAANESYGKEHATIAALDALDEALEDLE